MRKATGGLAAIAFGLGFAGLVAAPIALVAHLKEGLPEAVREKSVLSHARALQRRIVTLDSHVDIPPDYTKVPEHDPGRLTGMQVDLPKMHRGGMDAAFFIVYVGQGPRTPEGYEAAKDAALLKFTAIRRMAEELYPDEIELGVRAQDVARIHAAGKKAALIGIENGYVIGKDISLLEKYYDLGARYMTLAHIGHNDICDSSIPLSHLGDAEIEHGGLSAFGREVVAEMNRLGMMVDVSHISRDAMMEALRVSAAPVIASHSAVSVLGNHPRNLSDEQMEALARTGGVMQVVAFSAYVKVDAARAAEERGLRSRVARAAGDAHFSYIKHGKLPAFVNGMKEIGQRYDRASLEEFVDHIDYAVKVMGIDHVGISSDFGGGGGVKGWDNAAETVNVTAELIRRGYSDADIEKLWGGNLLRVWGEVEEVAMRLAERQEAGADAQTGEEDFLPEEESIAPAEHALGPNGG